MNTKNADYSDEGTMQDTLYEIPITQKLSSSRFVNRVLFPLLLLSLFYCVICYKILIKYGFSTAVKFALPLVPIGLGVSYYFRTHTTKRSAKFEFNEQWVAYFESDIVTGHLVYRIKSIRDINRTKQGIIIYGDIEKIRGSLCESQKMLCIDLPISEIIYNKLKTYEE